MCASVPPPMKVQLRKRRLEQAIRHAHMNEDTAECKVAWDVVEELSAAEHVREKERVRYEDDDREYDI